MSLQFLPSENHPIFINYFERNGVEWNVHDSQEKFININLTIEFVFEAQPSNKSTIEGVVRNTSCLLNVYTCNVGSGHLMVTNLVWSDKTTWEIFRETCCSATIHLFLNIMT